MRGRLLILGCFAHDSKRVLTGVIALALVRVELHLNVASSELAFGAGKLLVAVFADAEQWIFANNPEFSLYHAMSLRRSRSRSRLADFKRHHYRVLGKVAKMIGVP